MTQLGPVITLFDQSVLRQMKIYALKTAFRHGCLLKSFLINFSAENVKVLTKSGVGKIDGIIVIITSCHSHPVFSFIIILNV